MRIGTSPWQFSAQHPTGAPRERGEARPTVGRALDASVPARPATPSPASDDGTDLGTRIGRPARSKQPDAAPANPAAGDDSGVKRVLGMLERSFGLHGLSAVSMDLATTSISAMEQRTSVRQVSDASGALQASDYQASYTSYSSLHIAATGIVQAADGSQFSFSLDFLHEELYHAEQAGSTGGGVGPSTLTAGSAAEPSTSEPATRSATPLLARWLQNLDRQREERAAADASPSPAPHHPGLPGFFAVADPAWKDLRLGEGIGPLHELTAAGIGAMGVGGLDAVRDRADGRPRLADLARKLGLYLPTVDTMEAPALDVVG